MESLWTTRLRKCCVVLFAIYFCNLLLNFCSVYIAYVPSFVRASLGFLIMLVGFALVLRNVVYVIRNKIRIPKVFFILLGMVALMGVSGIANIQYGIIESLKIMVWSSILFFAVFPFFYTCERSQVFRELTYIFVPGFILWFVLIVISLCTFYLGVQEYELIVPEFIRPRYIGIHVNRLVGIFNDASMASTLSMFMTFVACFLLLNTSRMICKVMYVLVILCAIQYIVGTGARSSMVITVVCLTVVLWLSLRRKFLEKVKWKVMFQLCSFVAACLGSALFVFVGFGLVQTVMVETAQLTSSCVEFNSFNMDSFKDGDTSVLQGESNEVSDGHDALGDEAREISLERTDLEGKDITNLRADLWGEALTALFDKPFFGTSLDGFIPYVKEAYPKSFAAAGYDVGNGYLATLVYGGIFSFVLMLLFIFFECRILFHWIRQSQMNTRLDLREYIIISIAVGIAVSAAINMDVFYINFASTFLFWILLGAVNSFAIYPPKGKHEDNRITDHTAQR